MRSQTLTDVALAVQAAVEADERFEWFTAPGGTADGPYQLDRTNARLYVDGRLDVATGYAALVAGIDEFLGAAANVIPMRRRATYTPAAVEAVNEG